MKGANFVQECIPERLELKKSTYATIQKVTGPDAIICSSTSKLFPTKLQEGCLLYTSSSCSSARSWFCLLLQIY